MAAGCSTPNPLPLDTSKPSFRLLTSDSFARNDTLIPFLRILLRSLGAVSGQGGADEPEANAVRLSLFKDADDSRRRKEVRWPFSGVPWSAAGDYYRHRGKRFQFSLGQERKASPANFHGHR